MKKRMITLVCLLLVAAAGTLAQHWTVDPHAFQYDMTVYAQLSVAQQSDYELAAFCGDECRGVGKLLTASDGTQVFQLRVRSNVTEGETIMFRLYKRSADEELYVQETIGFEAQAVAGAPGEPVLLTLSGVKMGDVNGDGEVNEVDAQQILDVSVGLLKLSDLKVPQAVNVPGGNADALEVNAQIVLDYSVAKVKPW